MIVFTPIEYFISTMFVCLMAGLCGMMIGYVVCYGEGYRPLEEEDDPPTPPNDEPERTLESRGRAVPVYSRGVKVGEV